MDEQNKTPIPEEDKGNYFVYGMAIGLIVGIVFLYAFDSKLLMSICVFIGMLIGYFIKRK